MSAQYGINEYKDLLEKALREYGNPMNCPSWITPHSAEARVYLEAKREILVWCIEMLPETME